MTPATADLRWYLERAPKPGVGDLQLTCERIDDSRGYSVWFWASALPASPIEARRMLRAWLAELRRLCGLIEMPPPFQQTYDPVCVDG